MKSGANADRFHYVSVVVCASCPPSARAENTDAAEAAHARPRRGAGAGTVKEIQRRSLWPF